MIKDNVSILITNFNKEKYLTKSIQSCLSQNFKNKEIFFFDDCSTDNSIKILKKKNYNINIIYNKKKIFKSGTLNQIFAIYKIFKQSKGEIIFLLDSDDFFKKNKIDIIFKKFKNNKKLNFVQDRPYSIKYKKIMSLKKKSFNYSIWPSFYPTSCIAVRRNFFYNFFKFSQMAKFPNLEIDARLSIYAFLNNEFHVLKNNLTVYNFDRHGISSTYKKYSIGWWKKRKEAFEYMKILMKKKKLKFIYSFDYYLTKIINFFI